jgi:hypothetical protein
MPATRAWNAQKNLMQEDLKEDGKKDNERRLALLGLESSRAT